MQALLILIFISFLEINSPVTPAVAAEVFIEKANTQLANSVLLLLENFRLDCGRFPKTAEGLRALLVMPKALHCVVFPRGGYFRDGMIPKDVWGHHFILFSNGKTGTLISLGKDGKKGGSGEDADVSYPLPPLR